MLNLIRESKKGMTVIEVLVAMAVFGVISVPLMGIFLDSMVAVKLSQDKIETNALISVVKENITQNVKGNHAFELSDTHGKVNIMLNDISGSGITTGSATDLKIIDNKNNENINYKFDAERIQHFSTISSGGIGGFEYPNTCQYLVTIKNIHNNLAIQKFKIYINGMN